MWNKVKTSYNFFHSKSDFSCSKNHSSAISYSTVLGWEQCEVDTASLWSMIQIKEARAFPLEQNRKKTMMLLMFVLILKKTRASVTCVWERTGDRRNQKLYLLSLHLVSKLINTKMARKCRLLFWEARSYYSAKKRAVTRSAKNLYQWKHLKTLSIPYTGTLARKIGKKKKEKESRNSD